MNQADKIKLLDALEQVYEQLAVIENIMIRYAADRGTRGIDGTTYAKTS